MECDAVRRTPASILHPEDRNLYSEAHKNLKSKPSASQEGLYSMELAQTCSAEHK
jgi:hypothetical protein